MNKSSWAMPLQAENKGLDPLEEMMQFANDAEQDGGPPDLYRQSSIYNAKSMVMSIAAEEEQKKSLIDEQSIEITEKLEQVFTMGQFGVQKALIEDEFFKDNNKNIKRENIKMERARKVEEDANEVMLELIPKL